MIGSPPGGCAFISAVAAGVGTFLATGAGTCAPRRDAATTVARASVVSFIMGHRWESVRAAWDRAPKRRAAPSAGGRRVGRPRGARRLAAATQRYSAWGHAASD